MILNLGGGGVGLAFLTDLLISIPYLELTKVSLQEIFAKFKKKNTYEYSNFRGRWIGPDRQMFEFIFKKLIATHVYDDGQFLSPLILA